MKLGQGRGPEVCDNVQTAVDAQHQRIIANAVTNETGDRDWRSPMALQAKAGLGCPFDHLGQPESRALQQRGLHL